MNDLLRRILFLPDQASTYAVGVDHLHYFIIITTVLASGLVGLAAYVMIIVYRRRSESQRTPVVRPTAVHEVLFVGVPLSFFLLWFYLGYPQYVRLQTPPRGAMDVYVQAKKWMWKFSYPGGPNSLDALRVPADRPVRLLITSRDVIHSFFVPAFRIKQDAVPGRYVQTWFQATRPGSYQVFCAEYCGVGHSQMLASVIVMPPQEFDAWIAEQRRGLRLAQDAAATPGEAVDPLATLVQQGQRVAAEQGCFKCHTVDGTRHIGPTWLDLYHRQERLQDGRTILVDESYLTESMMDPAAKIVAGYQNVMPTFQGKLSAPDAAALLEFIKSLRTDAVRQPPSQGPLYAPIPSQR